MIVCFFVICTFCILCRFSVISNNEIITDTALVAIEMKAIENKSVTTVITPGMTSDAVHSDFTPVTLTLVPAELDIVIPFFTVVFKDEDGSILSE